MDENSLVEELVEKGLTRRDLLKRAAGAGIGLSVLSAWRSSARAPGEPPPDGPVDLPARHARRHGRLQPVGAHQDGYYARLGIDARLIAPRRAERLQCR